MKIDNAKINLDCSENVESRLKDGMKNETGLYCGIGSSLIYDKGQAAQNAFLKKKQKRISLVKSMRNQSSLSNSA